MFSLPIHFMLPPSLCLLCWQMDRKSAALAGDTFAENREATAMLGHKRMSQVEPNAESLSVTGFGVFSAIKTFCQTALFMGWNTNAAIFYTQLDVIACSV